MADIDTSNRSPGHMSHSTRNAALAVGGAVLLALGIAAGVMIGRPDVTEAPLDYAPPAAGVAEPLSAPDSAATPRTDGRTTDEDKPRSSERGAATSSRERTSASAGPREYESRRLARAAICAYCGVVESVTVVPIQNKSTGVGAVAGGVVGGVVGNQIGKGSGNTAATVLGAIGGGIAGNEIEKRRRTDTVYRVKVRMDDGSVQTFTREAEVPAGSRVEVHDGEMRVTNREG